MPIAAVPKYLGQDFKEASPAMRFGMYLKLWGINRRTQALLWKTHDINYERRGPQHQEREVKIENKVAALSDATSLSKRDQELLKGLAQRQGALAQILNADSLLRLEALAVAPFTTGLGNEHPLENGFAFLNPYGLPYLPGSGVKGVVRRAAQELASGMWEDDRAWKGLDQPAYRVTFGSGKSKVTLALSVLDVLFGREPPSGDSDAVRGALTFWDAIPQIAGGSLMVEIMTPHQSHYYQQNRDRRSGDSITPHDSGQPNPISFLTVPPGSGFAFHVVCDLPHLERLTREKLDGTPDLLADGRWKKLTQAAFEHAFAWLGFGAKTAVGYGALKASATQPAATASQKAQAGTNARPSSSAVAARTEVWENATLSWKPGPQEMTAAAEGKVSAPVKGGAEAQKRFADPAAFERLKKKQKITNVRVEVRMDGNQISIEKVLA